jgi:hypothetical protein
MAELYGYLFGSIRGPAEPEAVERASRILAVVAAALAIAFVGERRYAGRTSREWLWSAGTGLIALFSIGGFLLLFLVLPMQVGDWWYIYPREATSAVYIALAALPDLPRARLLRVAIVSALAVAVVPIAQVTTESYAQFGRSTEDYYTITRQLPLAPKLAYLVFEHGGSNRVTTPFIHLPAYVQAERGGWLSFHFGVWNASPVGLRDRDDPGTVLFPETPPRWEWTPHLFDVTTRGRFFDWFLVRQVRAPDKIFAADPSIERIDHVGTWWLYRRKIESGAEGQRLDSEGGALGE